ncbi:hypothetical protein VOLCADRAFT_98095 [Volvox carteri f. nagariensis]|uniref:Protein kinase domain-containing protein n=1 Tax=Volvox carteri f. nagariensis TaxID=3068 RepID=D8UEF5_VOLCA|nr:uncharacterized protein VOLCADRAFT_98095 [Volvox carteri f. nagariensis]EFJ41874.1 hypothetical protein VOLCADRAFT_98095 [Volvox carteri f. nagariensis]|eukprot:XP_002957072.1 hypothetical protein VOLCADRAFT_98095 [Volvox carteri f. nagariensis]
MCVCGFLRLCVKVPMKTITIMELLLSPKDAPLPPGVLEISLGNLKDQSMSMKSMGVYSASIPVRGQELSQLELDLIKVSVGAELQLEDVTFVVGCNELDLLLQTLCTNTRTWPYDPTGAVTVEGGIMHIRNLTSRVPGEDKDSTPGAGGEVRWSNVTIMCPVADRPARKACVARAVSSGSELYAAARKALVEEEGNTVLLSITGDVALPTDGSWVTIPLRPDQQLVLLGDPTRPSTSTIQLDLSGIPDAWSIQQPENSNPTACEGPRRTSRPVALLYDLLLVNLPYPTEPQGPMSLLAASLPCFTVVRGVLWSEGATQLSLTRSTIVVPDRELIFLAAAVGRNSSDVWPGQPQGGFLITVEKSTHYHQIEQQMESQQQVPEPSATAREFRGSSDPPGRLSVQELKLLSEVLLTDCVLMSTSSYQQLPGAVPLTPQSLTWLPELLEANDLETVNRWGHGGLAIFPGLQQALEDLVSCGVRDGYNPVRLIWRQDDTSIPQLDAICNSTAIMPAAASTTVRGPAADTCIVDGSSSASSVTTRQGMTTTRQKERGPRRHAFSDLQGAVSRIALARPITLRNLVLYNLAPGGAYPVAVTAQQEGSSLPSLRPSDVAWANSALPLWFFEFVRSTEADVSCQLTEENYSKIATKSTDVHTAAAANFTDNNNLLQQQHTTSCPLIFLENVTLVVPEPEWQALVAAVLMVHYPEVFWQKAAPAGREPTSSDQGAAGAAGDSSTPTTLKSKLAESGVASTLVGSVEDTIASIGGLPGSPSPPSPPHSPPSSPDNADTTRAALLGFATASQVLSYNHSSGELVLKVARHYGWIGSTVTITHKLPADAPDSAKLLTYPNLSFPHQDDDDDFKLAGVDIDLWIESSPSQPPPAGGTPPYSPLAAKTRIDQDPDSSTKERAAYYNDKIGNLRSGSSHDHQAVDEVWKVDSSKSSAALVVPRRHRGPRSMSDAIKAIHAELRDAELRLDYVIGSGASGAVYSGVWRGLPVAVKTRVVVTDLHEAKEGRVRQQAAAVLEAAISLSMSHPNVVVTYSYDVKPLVHAPSEADDGTGTQQSGSDDAAAGAAAGAAAAAAAAGSSRDAAERCAAQLGTCDVMKLYIVQEYCNGGTLRKALNQGMAGCVRAGGCARMLAVRLALDVAGGMAHIHSCRIVHGDLKPENVLLTLTSLRPDSRSRTDFASLTSASALATAGGGKAAVGLSAPAIPVDSSTSSGSAVAASLPVPVSAKVADFGLSTRLAEGATHVSGCFQGTTTYLAPEVVGKGQLSPGADIWAFGLILVELYYGCSFQDVETAYSAAAPMGSSSENYAVDYSLGTKSHAQAFLEDILASMADRSYAALAEGCLAAPPQERPSFRELAAALRTLAEEQQQQQ